MSLDFVSVGANKHPHCADWNGTNVVAFGAGRTVALWDVDQGLCGTLKGHGNPVTAVKFYKDYIVSGSSDKTVKIWTKEESGYVCCGTLKHTGSITALAVCAEADLIVSGSSDGSVWLWKFSSQELIESCTVNARFHPLCVAATMFNGNVIVGAGGSQNNVYIFSNSSGQFKLDASLEGHENWIRSLDFRPYNGDLLLASASQDKYIRLWRFHCGSTDTIESRTTTADDVDTALLSNKEYSISGGISVTFEALLMGHDDWIFSVSWHPVRLELLSSSADTSVMIWNPDESSGVWVCSSRLGDVSIKGASTATGASGGFWAALYLVKQDNQQQERIATVGKTGAWRLWRSKGAHEFSALVGITGHIRPVSDLSWEDNGQYLLTASLDQTTRLYAQSAGEGGSWHEMSRPQIHGYDMIAVKSINGHAFVSGGDEKTIRVFEEPKGIAHLLENVCGIKTENIEAMADSAMVPALSLSNKQDDPSRGEVEDDDDEPQEAHESTIDILSRLTTPPLEDHLQRHTLWPEVDKLYGHGYEISSIDISHDKKVVATCCKANTEAHAVIRLYNTSTWQQIENPLAFHSLTITRLQFSPDDKYLLSVSRDRTLSLWKRTGDYDFELSFSDPKAHSRIVWDCCWTQDGFLTAGRDRCVKLWRKQQDETWQAIAISKFQSPVTAIDCSGDLIAVGLDDGALSVHKIEGNEIVPLRTVDSRHTPDLRVDRIAWRPNRNQFAVASQDSTVRIYSL
uniref:Elongator complex protein 2 n=1 Tax=Blastobotrys adeninivorans TaxID=409370 RepID=A0A060T398_BLAAD